MREPQSLTVNGQKREFPEGATLTNLLVSLGIDPTKVAVEHNRAIVPRSRYAATALSPGDLIEIVQFVGGG
jgi:sulfur carrier protein